MYKKKYLWDIAYVLYFLSFYVDDLAFTSEAVQTAVFKVLRYAAYLMFVLVLYQQQQEKRSRVIVVACGMGFALLCTVFNRDMYYGALLFILLTSFTIKPDHIVRLSYGLLLSLSLLTVIGALTHVIPMVDSPRSYGSSSRYALGFYHSDVMPLVLFYLIVYRIIMDHRHLRARRIPLWLAMNFILYYVCGSKNGLIGVLMLCAGCLIYRKRKKPSKFLYGMSAYSVIVFSLVSLLVMAMQRGGGTLAVLLNRMMTNRFYLAYRQMRRMGVHIINRMDWARYIEMREVLDNGYLFVALRYGLVFLLFYWLVHYCFSRKYRKDNLILGVSVVISLTNMIDNDLMSYGYLPIILLAFNSLGVGDCEKAGSQRRRIVWKD